jgi:hypothetical protein
MRFVALFILLLAETAFAVEPALEMQRVVRSFYKLYFTVRPSGVPSEKEQQKFKPYLSAVLAKVLKEADQAEQQYRKKTRGEVPPLLDGDLFTSLFEGATEFKVLSCDTKTSSCLVEFSYVESRKGASPTTSWKDKVYLVKDPQGWMVDDIEFLGDWRFMHKGRLQDLLKQVIKEGNDS